MKTVDQSLEEVLYDMKAKYDAANQGQASQAQKITNVQTAKDAVEKAIQSMTVTLQKKCTDLKAICSGFNLVDELHVMISQLETESRALVSLEARKSADAFIRSIKQVCDSLSAQQVTQNMKRVSLGEKPTVNPESDEDSDSDYDDREGNDSDDDYHQVTTPTRVSNLGVPHTNIFVNPILDKGTPAPLFSVPQTSIVDGDIRNCRQCGADFLLTDSEKKWYLSKNYELPQACKNCTAQKSIPFGRAGRGKGKFTKDPKKRGGPKKSSKASHVISPSAAQQPFKAASLAPAGQNFCKVCGLAFMMQQSEIDWFVSRSIPPPKTCKPCRDKKR